MGAYPLIIEHLGIQFQAAKTQFSKSQGKREKSYLEGFVPAILIA